MSNKPTPIEQFMYWQCRIRQDSVRNLEGRPTSGMCPTVSLPEDSASLGTINTLITKLDSESYTAQFRHIVRKTQDPADRVKGGMRLLAEAYYQQSKGFSTELLALFSLDSEFAKQLLNAEKCMLTFSQDSKTHTLNCAVRDVLEEDAAHQAIYWHNHMFNPGMPGRVRVLGFLPS